MPAWLLTLPTMFAKSSCALNPIIYTVMNSSFRKQVRNKLPIVENKSRGVATTEQNGPHCVLPMGGGCWGRRYNVPSKPSYTTVLFGYLDVDLLTV